MMLGASSISPYPYYLGSNRKDSDTGAKYIISESGYGSEANIWRVLEGISDWEKESASIRLDCVEVGSEAHITEWDGTGNTNDTNSLVCRIGGWNLVTARAFRGYIALTGLWADIVPTEAQLAANYNWIREHILGVTE